MAEIGILLSVSQTLFAALESSHLKSLCSTFAYKSELDDLKETVSTIHNLLLDADSKQNLTNEAQDWIHKLKDAIYDADDIFDYFVFMIEQKNITVGGFFGVFNPIVVSYRLSKGIKIVRKKLDKIASNHSRYGFSSVDYGYVAVRRKLRETESSLLVQEGVVGREWDVKGVIEMLVEFHVVSIVGIGGLGKTTLAQLVYNDDNVKKEYSLRMWVCVSDQDEKRFDLNSIVGKILESATGDKHEGFSLDSLLNRVRKLLEVNKYFLVLDDVWNEDSIEWDKLIGVLRVGWSGSKVVVTTRSRKTGEVIRGGCIYELKGLSEDESWRLFQMTAFRDREGEGSSSSRTLIEAGKKIVKKCVNVPLAIKVVGSLLFSEDEDTWLSFQERELSDIRNDKNEIMQILKLSYHYLDPKLKSCFAYCALFPKDFVIKKDMLISLWIAQGYVVPLDNGQSVEDAAEEYFSTLLRKCFFQDTQVNGYGQIVSCKIHDLIHDVAQQVAGNEIGLGNGIRHVFHVQREGVVAPFTKTKIRSYLRDGWSSLLPVDTLISNCTYLRSLDLHNLDIKILPDSIGNLLHLRYLDLSWNHDLRKLPKTITRLHYLQTLYLKDCFCLQELPKNLSSLVNLRQLDIIGCKGLSYMPSGLDKLSNLCVLTTFPVAEHNSNENQHVGQLRDLKALTKLKGHLSIWIKGNMKYTRPLVPGEEGYLKRMERLKSLRISWKGEENDRRIADEEALLEDLQPHHNLKELMLIGYYGVVIPRWGREDAAGTFLPNLVKIELENCPGLQSFTSMGKLHCLKFLKLVSLINFEYCEETTSGSQAVTSTFFSSLEELVLWDLPNFKGWWKTVGPSQPSFPRLSKLVVGRCPNLASIPPCPTVSTLSLYWINKSLPITMGKDHMSILSRNSSQSSLPMGRLTKIDITGAKNLTSLSEMSELFQTCSSSLQSLTIENCYQLESLSGGFKHLNSLETLKIHDVPNLSFSEEQDQDNPWVSLNKSLRSLDLCHLPLLVKLPKGISCLTSLQTMKIQLCQSLEEIPGWIVSLSCVQSLHLIGCDKLVSLPEEISKVTSLRRIEVRRCSDVLKERCQSPDGLDWHKIQFISSVSIS